VRAGVGRDGDGGLVGVGREQEWLTTLASEAVADGGGSGM